MSHGIEVPAGWDIAGNTNGGLLMSLALAPMKAACRRQCPLSLTAHFLRPVTFGEAQVTTELIKEGRMLATVGAEMTFAGKPVIRMLGAFGDLPQQESPVNFSAAGPPEIAPVESCVIPWVPPAARPFYQHVELRADPATPSILTGKRAGKGEFECWISPLEGAEQVAVADLPVLVDGFPPPVFDLELPVNWVPTVELTVHVRGVPAPGWLRSRVRTRFVRYGLLEEEVELWDSSDQLVALSRQLALVPRPPDA